MILCVQIFITISFVAYSVSSDDMYWFMVTHVTLYWIAFGVSIGILIGLLCFHRLARNVPINYILLFTFTIAETYMVAAISIWEDPQIVMIAAVMTGSVFIALTTFALFTDIDLTYRSGLIMVLIFGFIFAFILYIIYPSYILHIAISILGIIIVGMFIIYDTQLIAGQKKYKLSYDEYIIGALMLYTDIITMFLCILSLMGGGGSR
jgi:FtsH-binding integral membrane protein